jgi:hypothetical protein
MDAWPCAPFVKLRVTHGTKSCIIFCHPELVEECDNREGQAEGCLAHEQTGSPLPLHLLNRGGGAVAIYKGDGGDEAAAGLDELVADDVFQLVVAAFHEDVGLHVGDEIEGGIFTEEDDGVDAGEGGEDAGARLFMVHGAGGALQAADTRVGVEAEYQPVAEGAGSL